MKNLYEAEPALKEISGISTWMVAKVLVVATLGVAATLVYVAKAPRKYDSEAKLLVRLGRESITLDPTVTNGQVVSVSDSRESEVNAISDLITSRVILEKVVDKISPDVIVGKTDDSKGLGDYLAPLNEVNLNPFRVYSDRDDAIEHLLKHLEVRTGKRSALITVTMQAEDPIVAREVLQEIVSQARTEHVKANHTDGSEEFFEKQVTLLRAEVARHEDALRELKDSTGIASFEQQQQILLERIGELETDLSKTTAEKEAVEKEVRARTEALSHLPELIVTEQKTGQPQTPEFEMRSKLFDLELREKELASKYTDESPLLQQLRIQVAQARKSVAEEQRNTEVTKGVSKTRESMETQLQDREAAYVNAKARIEALQAQLKEAQGRKAELNSFKVKADAQQLELTLATANFKKYSENLEQARIDSQLQMAKISSIVVLEPPTESQTPSSPNTILVLAMGGVLSLLSGVGVALVTDRAKPKAIAVKAETAAEPAVKSVDPTKSDEPAVRSEPRSRRSTDVPVPAQPR